MRIANIMFSRSGGGIEQAAVDYCEGLSALGHQVVAITAPDAFINADLKKLGIENHKINNLGEWDVFAVRKLRKILRELKIDVVIAHANRAFGLARKAVKGESPIVGVVQNYNTRRYSEADFVFTTTNDLIEVLHNKEAIPRDKIFHIPNMVSVKELPRRDGRRSPPVIGAMGRLVAKKGFEIYIDALKILDSRGVEFRAVLGGGGEEESTLRIRAAKAELGKKLQFSGWINDKKKFYTDIDIFCLPSLHEPFGIVLLEAFGYGVPVISTNSEGPKEIITPGYDALVVESGKAEELANMMEKLIKDAEMCDMLAANAFAKVKTIYATDVVCRQIETALYRIKEEYVAEY